MLASFSLSKSTSHRLHDYFFYPSRYWPGKWLKLVELEKPVYESDLAWNKNNNQQQRSSVFFLAIAAIASNLGPWTHQVHTFCEILILWQRTVRGRGQSVGRHLPGRSHLRRWHHLRRLYHLRRWHHLRRLHHLRRTSTSKRDQVARLCNVGSFIIA